MKCDKTRDEIETIENLRDENHSAPETVSSHLEECAACEKYYRASRVLEREIFSKIKDIKGSAVPLSITAAKPNRPFLKTMILSLPFACAALLLLIIHLSDADITEVLLSRALAGTVALTPADPETVSRVFSVFEQKTGIKPHMPADKPSCVVQKGSLISAEGTVVCAFSCLYSKCRCYMFIYEGHKAHWSCCSNVPCTCLSTHDCRAERWKEGNIGYLIVIPGADGTDRDGT